MKKLLTLPCVEADWDGQPLQLPIAIHSKNVLQKSCVNAVKIIISGLEEKDSYTHGHSIRVAEYCLLVAKALRMKFHETKTLELAALLHDIGKIGIPDTILLKPGKLEMTEFEIMKSHPQRSAKILRVVPGAAHLIPGIKHHHERYDGLGYPDGLSGNSIPLIARIILIADTYDAMTSTRPYRLALTQKTAVEELQKCAGTQFDPYLVEAFIHALMNRLVIKKIQKPRPLKKIA